MSDRKEMGPCTKAVFVCKQWKLTYAGQWFSEEQELLYPRPKKEVVNLAHEGHQGVHGNRNIDPVKPFYFPDQGDWAGIEEPEIATSTALPPPRKQKYSPLVLACNHLQPIQNH